jgi:tetratricopeptide (TPR) repeat protein
VAYAQLPRAARADKHRLAAEWIAAGPATRPDLVAHHYTEALELARAAGTDTTALEQPARRSLRAAGDRARSLGAYHDATDLYRRALTLDPDDVERRSLLGAIVGTASASLDPEAGSWADEALVAYEAAGDYAGAADAETALSTIAWYAGNGKAAASHGERAVAFAERSGSDESLARALADLARRLMLAGRNEESIQVGGRAILLAEAAGLEEVAVDSLVTVGTARGNVGADAAIEVLQGALERARAISAPVPIYRALNNQVYLIRRLDGLAASLPVRDQVESEVLRRYGMLSTLRWFDSSAAWDSYQEGKWDDALERADSFFRRSSQRHALDHTVLLVRAWVALARGDQQSASADLERAFARARGVDDPYLMGPASVYFARIALLSGMSDEAESFTDMLEALEQNAIGLAADCTTEVAWLAVDLGRRFELEASPSIWRVANDAILDGRLGEAIDILDATGVHTEAAYARLRRAQREPGPWLEEAEAFYREVGATRFLDEIAELRERAIPRSA